MIDWANGFVGSLELLIKNAITVIGIATVGLVYYRTKAFGPTLGALLLAGAVVWGVRNIEWLEQKVGEEAGLGTPAARVVSAR